MARKRVGNKRERIIAAAGRLFGERGYHNTTTAEIAEAAGVAAGTIYIYFSSKEELLVAVFEEFLSEHMDRLRSAVAAERDPISKIRVLLTRGFRLMEENPESAKIFLSQLRQSTDMIKMVAKRSSRAYLDIIESILAEGVRTGLCRELDVHLAATMLFGCFQMVVYDWVASGGADSGTASYSLVEKAEEVARFVLEGVACRPSAS
jgi:TetR/AcrR family fatty acid metabolism transcriptional regulator